MAARKESNVGRPSASESRTEGRPQRRASVGGYRDKLTVHGQDPEYSYRWILSTSSDSGRILQLRERGYEFASSKDHTVGETNVYTTKDGSSLIRVPASKEGDFLYLMRIKKQWYEEDQEEKARRILDEHEAVRKYSSQEGAGGVYGKFELK